MAGSNHSALETRRRRLLGMAAAWAAWPTGAQAAPGYPSRPIRLIIPFTPGGIYFAMLKAVTDHVGESMRTSFVLDHRPGAGTTLGTALLAKAAPDGYTLGVLGNVQAVNTAYYRKAGYDLAQDFIPIIGIAEMPVLLLARPDAPFKTLAELVAYGRAHPSSLTYGAATSYPMDLLAIAAGVDYTHIPYKGHPEAMGDLLASRIDLSAGPGAVMLDLVKSGRLRPIAIMGRRRANFLPNVPAVAEVVPDYHDASVWVSVAAPKGVQDSVMQSLRTAFHAALAAPGVRQALTAQGLDTSFAGASPQSISARLGADAQRARLIAARTQKYEN